MANLKDLIVNGTARIVGKIYSSGGFVGNLIGNADTATNSTKVNNHTVEKDVPSNAVFTDTWRGIQNNLTSDSTTDSLSAAQGKALKALVDGKAASSHTHSSYVNQNAFSNVVVGSTTVAADSATDTLTLVSGSNVTITPDATNDKITIAATDTNTWRPLGTTADTACAGNDSRLSNARPASDVYSWAKASSKPSYSWNEITNKPTTFEPMGHTHSAVNGVTPEWAGSIAWDDTGWIAAWNNDGTKLKALAKSSFAPASHGTHVPSTCTMITDWNNATTNGWYMGSNASNQPVSNGGWFYGVAIVHNTNYIRQIAWHFATDSTVSGTNCDKYERVKHSGTWGSWLNTSVRTAIPSNAKFTDTWRGIQNNLTSDSTTDSLSAAQGKVLKGLVDGKAASDHTHSYLPLSGGTMTGDIKLNTDSSNLATRVGNAVYGIAFVDDIGVRIGDISNYSDSELSSFNRDTDRANDGTTYFINDVQFHESASFYSSLSFYRKNIMHYLNYVETKTISGSNIKSGTLIAYKYGLIVYFVFNGVIFNVVSGTVASSGYSLQNTIFGTHLDSWSGGTPFAYVDTYGTISVANVNTSTQYWGVLTAVIGD